MSEGGRILLIDDDELVARYFKEKLSQDADYFVYVASDSQTAVDILKEKSFDIILLKIGMPDLDCRELISAIGDLDRGGIIIGIIEEKTIPSLLDELTRLGVYDFITQNVSLEKLFFLIKKGIELKFLASTHNKLIAGLREQNSILQKQNTLLAKRIEEATKNLTRLYDDLRSTYMRTIKALAQTIDARDHYTHSHSENVVKYAAVIAEELRLSCEDVEMIREACELHDLGKVGIEDNILGKPTSLTDAEWVQIKRHPTTGAQILEPLTFLDGVIDLVRQHHERYDGLGYPLGLKGEDILLGARIINLADAYEAMTSARAYRKNPLTREDALAEIRKNSGKQFDPRVVEAFLRIVNKI